MATVAERRKANRMRVAVGLSQFNDIKKTYQWWMTIGTSKIAEFCDHPIGDKFVQKNGSLVCRSCDAARRNAARDDRERELGRKRYDEKLKAEGKKRFRNTKYSKAEAKEVRTRA